MKTIKEEILIEEVETLLKGGEIGFFENENIKLKISGKENLKGVNWKKRFEEG